ncbi:unnamed protein product, partial [Trichogramma brassicae]
LYWKSSLYTYLKLIKLKKLGWEAQCDRLTALETDENERSTRAPLGTIVSNHFTVIRFLSSLLYNALPINNSQEGVKIVRLCSWSALWSRWCKKLNEKNIYCVVNIYLATFLASSCPHRLSRLREHDQVATTYGTSPPATIYGAERSLAFPILVTTRQLRDLHRGREGERNFFYKKRPKKFARAGRGGHSQRQPEHYLRCRRGSFVTYHLTSFFLRPAARLWRRGSSRRATFSAAAAANNTGSHHRASSSAADFAKFTPAATTAAAGQLREASAEFLRSGVSTAAPCKTSTGPTSKTTPTKSGELLRDHASSPPIQDGVAEATSVQSQETVPALAVPDGGAATGSLIDLNARCSGRCGSFFPPAALQVNSVHCLTPESMSPATSYVNLAPTPQGFTPSQQVSPAASLLECFDPLESRDRPPSRMGSDNFNPMGRSSVTSSLALSQSANKSFSFVNFWRHHPELWLETIEQKFAACGIFLDNDRYMHTLAALGTDVIAELGDSMRGLPMSNKYPALKALLRRKFRDGSVSARNRLPSDYLDYLVGSGDNLFNRDSILRWWSLTLPPHIAVHLDAEVTVANELDNVRRADEIYYRLQGTDKAFPSVHKIDAPPAKVELPAQENVLAGLRNSIDILTQVLLNDRVSRSSPDMTGQGGGAHGRNYTAKNNNHRNFNNRDNQSQNFNGQNFNGNNRKFKNNHTGPGESFLADPLEDGRSTQNCFDYTVWLIRVQGNDLWHAKCRADLPKDIRAETVARAFVKHWVSRFGSPSILTTDQGTQFESRLFEEVSRALGIEKIHTTPYHPQANGMIERFHRDIKAAFMCRGETGDWLDSLPTVLLGLRTRPILDTDLSPAEMLYGRALRIPGIFCEYDDDDFDSRSFRETFLRYMMDVKSLPVRHKTSTRPFYYDDLDTCTHVFRVVKSNKQSLQRPYTGPHQVISRDPSKKHMEIRVDNKVIRVSVDQLKPAHFLDQALARQAAAPTDRPPSASPVGVLLPSASGMAPLQPSSMAPPPSRAPLATPQPSTSFATTTVAPDDLAHAEIPEDKAVADEDNLSLSDFPEMTQDELGLGHSVTVGDAADAPLPPDQPSFSSEHTYSNASRLGAFDELRNETATALERYPHLVELADGVMDEIRRIETSKYRDDIQHRLRPARTGRTRADSAEYEPLPDLPRLVIGSKPILRLYFFGVCERMKQDAIYRLLQPISAPPDFTITRPRHPPGKINRTWCHINCKNLVTSLRLQHAGLSVLLDLASAQQRHLSEHPGGAINRRRSAPFSEYAAGWSRPAFASGDAPPIRVTMLNNAQLPQGDEKPLSRATNSSFKARKSR